MMRIRKNCQPILNVPSLIPRLPPSQSRSYKANDLRLGGVERVSLLKELTDRVIKKQECWSYQIQSLAYMIGMEGNYGRTSPVEATYLLKACQMDIVDIFPSEQSILTEIVWDSLRSAQMIGKNDLFKRKRS